MLSSRQLGWPLGRLSIWAALALTALCACGEGFSTGSAGAGGTAAGVGGSGGAGGTATGTGGAAGAGGVGGSAGAGGAVPSTATRLIDGQDGPWGVAVESGVVYWTNRDGGAIRSMPIAGGAAAPVAPANEPLGIAVRGGVITWADLGNDVACRHAGSPPATSCAGTPGDKPEGVALSASLATYCTATGADAVVRWDGSSSDVAAPGQLAPAGISIQGATIYWANRGSNAILSMATTGNVPALEASTSGSPEQVAASAAGVFWTVPLAGTVQGKLTNGTVITISEMEEQPWGIAVDGVRIYWTDRAAGMVRSARVDGSGIATLSSGHQDPLGIAVDDDSVYWTDYGSGAIWKAGKVGVF